MSIVQRTRDKAAPIQKRTAAPRLGFTEREPYETGFARVFDAEILPGLAELDAARRRLRRERMLRVVVGLIVAAVIIGGAFALSDNDFVLGVALVGAILGMVWIFGSTTSQYRDRLRALVMPAVTRFLGVSYHRTPPAEFDSAEFVRLKAVGDYEARRSTIQDYLTGAHHGRQYELAEANLRRRAGKSDTVVFRGLLLTTPWPEAADADVLIGRDYGKLFNKMAGIGKAEPVSFEQHPAFEKLYQVYATDAAAARRLLTPAFLDSMVALSEGKKGGRPTAAFSRGRFLLAVPLTEDLFEPGSLSREMDEFEEDMHKLLRHMTIPHRIIDVLEGRGSPRIL
jgi:hypothetical protein